MLILEEGEIIIIEMSFNYLLICFSDDFMGQIILHLSESKSFQPLWIPLKQRKKKEYVSGDILIGVEITTAEEHQKILNETEERFVPIYYWKYQERLNYQKTVPRHEIPHAVCGTSSDIENWRRIVKRSLLRESSKMPRYMYDAYACLPPGSILGGTIKLISLSEGTFHESYLRIYITDFLPENNLLVGYRIYRKESTHKKCYIRFLPFQYGVKGKRASSKLSMLVIDDRYLIRGPCFVDAKTGSLGLYIPINDVFDYIPISSRSDAKATTPIKNGKVRDWAVSLVDGSDQPVGELRTPLCKLATIEPREDIPTPVISKREIEEAEEEIEKAQKELEELQLQKETQSNEED